MSEVYKITNMLVTNEDIENIDKNWQSIIDEYTKTLVREKDLVIAQYLMKKQKQEIERLNNIINELEKELQEGSFNVYFCSLNSQKTFKSNEIIIKSLILDKLKELKGEDK